ncbi:hypothetical protein GIB67_023742 [Kingdonia uniflora]|uniref:Wound-responsive family protein n=1 Tax=Kingdonia uniflora TaxID=39325 RepID=A0A7J7MGC3_9MAGN|nr:hypothetical protein GIB67_023742 [Kingdonia uniflora]
MGSVRRAWVVAVSVGAVEALKDQGFCRWNYALRSLQQRAKNNVRLFVEANKISSSSSFAIAKKMSDENQMKQSEESLRKVMFLSCWGPN